MNKINPVYSVQEKQNGDAVNGSDWNALNNAVTQAQNKINEIIDNGGSSSESGSSSGGSSDSHISVNAKGNLTIETTEADLVNDKGAKINIEPYSDLQIKPGDDISLYSHHRSDTEELSVKVLNGAEVSPTDNAEIEEYPVDLQLNTANIVVTTKDKDIYISEKNKARAASGKDETSDKSNILNLEIKTGVKAKKATASKGQYGYLKVRGQAIDIRCEDHGGIALQPKGYDSDGNMNKIKFEHGGGDGLEFGTFNTEKSSLFTDEYRFKKDGVIKLSTRQMIDSGKTDDGVFDNTPSGKVATNAKKYVKQDDDFYDIIDENDPQCTWNDIINLGAKLGKENVKVFNRRTKGVEIHTYKQEDSDAAGNCSIISENDAALQGKQNTIINAGPSNPYCSSVSTTKPQTYDRIYQIQDGETLNISEGDVVDVATMINNHWSGYVDSDDVFHNTRSIANLFGYLYYKPEENIYLKTTVNEVETYYKLSTVYDDVYLDLVSDGVINLTGRKNVVVDTPVLNINENTKLTVGEYYNVTFEYNSSISSPDISHTFNVPGDTYSDLTNGTRYTKAELEARYLYSKDFDALEDGQQIDLTIHNDNTGDVVAGGFIVHKTLNTKQLTLGDIYKVVEYFKNNNSTGPFANS